MTYPDGSENNIRFSSPQYEVYAEHILKHFNNAIKDYTQYEYDLQDFL